MPSAPARHGNSAAATTGPGVQGARYRLHVGADAVPFGADFRGAPAGSAVAGWYALGAAAVVLACAAVVVAVHHRPMLSGLSPAADLAARRVAVDRTVRIGVAQLCWIGLAAVAGRLEVAARATAADAAAAAFEAQQAGAISTPELVDRLRELDPASPATTLLLGGTVAVILVLALLKPYRDLRTLRADGASAVEVAIVAEEFGRGLVDVPYLGPMLIDDLQNRLGRAVLPPESAPESVDLTGSLAGVVESPSDLTELSDDDVDRIFRALADAGRARDFARG